MTKPKYEVGGKVRVSGEWYEIFAVHENDENHPIRVKLHEVGICSWPHHYFIQEYTPPKPKVYEWLTSADVSYAYVPTVQGNTNLLNQILTERYGDPATFAKPRKVQPHNPDNLTPEQVDIKGGWRLLNKDEIGDIDDAVSFPISRWSGEVMGWLGGYGTATMPLKTYRTKLTREELRKDRGLE